MQHNKKTIRYLLYLCIGMIFAACTLEEDVIEEHSHEQKVNIQQKSIHELMKSKTFSNAYRKIPKKKIRKTNSFGRSIIEETFGFTIIDAPINVTETEELLNYNILVYSDSLVRNHEDYFENLVISINKNTLVQTIALVKYNLDTSLEYASDGAFYFSSNNEINYLLKEDGNPCEPIKVLLCRYQENTGGCHFAGENCTQTFWGYYYPCDDIATGFSGGGGGGSSSSGTSGSPSNSGTTSGGDSGSSGGTGIGITVTNNTSSNNTSSSELGGGSTGGSTSLIDNPTPPCEGCPELEEEQSQCQSMKSVSDNATISSIIQLMKARTTRPRESGATFQYANNTVSVAYGSNATEGSVRLTYNQNTFGGIHVHQNGVFPMFSFGDLQPLLRACQYNPSAGNSTLNVPFDNLPFFMMVVNSQQGTNDYTASPYGYCYSIVANNPQQFLTFENSLTTRKIDRENENLFNEFSNNGSVNWDEVNQEDLAVKFLNFVQNFNISLYRIKLNNLGLPTGSWEKLSLTPSPNNPSINILEKTTCNN